MRELELSTETVAHAARYEMLRLSHVGKEYEAVCLPLCTAANKKTLWVKAINLSCTMKDGTTIDTDTDIETATKDIKDAPIKYKEYCDVTSCVLDALLINGDAIWDNVNPLELTIEEWVSRSARYFWGPPLRVRGVDGLKVAAMPPAEREQLKKASAEKQAKRLVSPRANLCSRLRFARAG